MERHQVLYAHEAGQQTWWQPGAPMASDASPRITVCVCMHVRVCMCVSAEKHVCILSAFFLKYSPHTCSHVPASLLCIKKAQGQSPLSAAVPHSHPPSLYPNTTAPTSSWHPATRCPPLRFQSPPVGWSSSSSPRGRGTIETSPSPLPCHLLERHILQRHYPR